MTPTPSTSSPPSFHFIRYNKHTVSRGTQTERQWHRQLFLTVSRGTSHLQTLVYVFPPGCEKVTGPVPVDTPGVVSRLLQGRSFFQPNVWFVTWDGSVRTPTLGRLFFKVTGVSIIGYPTHTGGILVSWSNPHTGGILTSCSKSITYSWHRVDSTMLVVPGVPEK